jgi:hypothetical protein
VTESTQHGLQILCVLQELYLHHHKYEKGYHSKVDIYPRIPVTEHDGVLEACIAGVGEQGIDHHEK